MSTWRILEWSRALGRGAIAGAHYPRVEFDASRADVDDFVIGEVVHVEVEGDGPGLRVRRVWPDLPRFRASHATSEIVVPPLDASLAAQAEAAVAAANGWTDIRVALGENVVRFEVGDDISLDGVSGALELSTPSYIELSTEIEPRNMQLAGPEMRRYLATRVDLGAHDIAVAIIDTADRFFFVVARGVTFTRTA